MPRLFIADLGVPVSLLSELSKYEKAMFSIFGSRLLADGADHGAAQVLLDQLNHSFHTGAWNGKPGSTDLSLRDAAFARYSSHRDAAKWLAKYPYPRNALRSPRFRPAAFVTFPMAQGR